MIDREAGIFVSALNLSTDPKGTFVKIRVDRDALADAVAWVARSLPSRPTAPILAGMLLEADGDGLTLSSFDSTTSAKVTMPATVHDEGTVLVSGRLLNEIARSLPNKPVDMVADHSKVELTCGQARFTLQTLPVDEYPTLPDMPTQTGTVASADFEKAVAQVFVAAGRDELLNVFTGVKLEINGENLSLLATDRYRMALKELTWNPSTPGVEGNVLVPGKVLADTAKSMTSGENVTISLSTTQAEGEGLAGFIGEGAKGSREATTRLLSQAFPKVRHLMDVQASVSVRVSTADLLAAVKRVALVAERNTPLRMRINEDHITLEAATGDQAQASEAIEAVVENHAGGESPITAAGFNPHYLQDALAALDTPYVHFAFTAPGKPCLVMGLTDLDSDPLPDYKHVIMLMRLPN